MAVTCQPFDHPCWGSWSGGLKRYSLSPSPLQVHPYQSYMLGRGGTHPHREEGCFLGQRYMNSSAPLLEPSNLCAPLHQYIYCRPQLLIQSFWCIWSRIFREIKLNEVIKLELGFKWFSVFTRNRRELAQQKGSFLQDRKRTFTRNQIGRHLDLGSLAFKSMRK